MFYYQASGEAVRSIKNHPYIFKSTCVPKFFMRNASDDKAKVFRKEAFFRHPELSINVN